MGFRPILSIQFVARISRAVAEEMALSLCRPKPANKPSHITVMVDNVAHSVIVISVVWYVISKGIKILCRELEIWIGRALSNNDSNKTNRHRKYETNDCDYGNVEGSRSLLEAEEDVSNIGKSTSLISESFVKNRQRIGGIILSNV